MATVYNEIPSSKLMTFDVSFTRMNGQPLDGTEVYYSLESAQKYAQTGTAYAGQIIKVVPVNYSNWTYSDENDEHVLSYSGGKWTLDGNSEVEALETDLELKIGSITATRTVVSYGSVKSYQVEADGSLTELADKESVSAIAGILGDLDSETLENIKDAADAVASKMDKLTKEDGAPDFTGNLAKFDDKGQVIDSGEKISDYAKTSYVNTELDKKATKTELTEAISGVNSEVAEKLDIETAESDYLKKTDAADAYTVVVTSDEGEGSVLKKYTITQGKDAEGKDIVIGTIDIPKDLVVTEGKLVIAGDGTEGTEVIDGSTAGDKYIKLTIGNSDKPVYIAVKDLVDVYTAAENATEVQLSISDTNEISASIVAVSSEKVTHGEGTVKTALEGLESTKRDKDDNVVTKDSYVFTDWVVTSDNLEVKELFDKTPPTVTRDEDHWTIHYSGSNFEIAWSNIPESADATSLESYGYLNGDETHSIYITATRSKVKVATIGESYVSQSYVDAKSTEALTEAKAYVDSKSVTALDDAKAYTDSEIQKLDADLDAAGTAEKGGTFVVSGITQTDGKIIAVDSIEVEAAGAAAQVKTEVIGTSTDTSTDDTIYGAKKYADAAVAPINQKLSVLEGDVNQPGSIDEKINTVISGLDSYIDASVDSEMEEGSVAVLTGITITDGKLVEDSVRSQEVATPAQVSSKVAAVKTELLGTDADASTADTIKGAKKYAEEVAASEVSKVSSKIYLGTTTTNLVDNNVSTIKINDEDVIATTGSMAMYNSELYIWTGSKWEAASKHTAELASKADKSYVDDELAKKADKTTTIAGVDLQDNITKEELLTALNVEDGAEKNVIVKIKVGDTELTPDSDRMITIDNLILDGGGTITDIA